MQGARLFVSGLLIATACGSSGTIRDDAPEGPDHTPPNWWDAGLDRFSDGGGKDAATSSSGSVYELVDAKAPIHDFSDECEKWEADTPVTFTTVTSASHTPGKTACQVCAPEGTTKVILKGPWFSVDTGDFKCEAFFLRPPGETDPATARVTLAIGGYVKLPALVAGDALSGNGWESRSRGDNELYSNRAKLAIELASPGPWTGSSCIIFDDASVSRR